MNKDVYINNNLLCILWLSGKGHNCETTDKKRVESNTGNVRFRRGRKFVVLVVGGRAAS